MIDNGNVDYVNEVIKEVDWKIKECNKYIWVYNFLFGMWEMVKYYVMNLVVSDLDDVSNIYKVENWVFKKVKLKG